MKTNKLFSSGSEKYNVTGDQRDLETYYINKCIVVMAPEVSDKRNLFAPASIDSRVVEYHDTGRIVTDLKQSAII
jgi:hypothetical protein